MNLVLKKDSLTKYLNLNFESKNTYGERVANAMIDQIFDQIAPRFDRANALASQTKN
jgi:hypothetical protein